MQYVNSRCTRTLPIALIGAAVLWGSAFADTIPYTRALVVNHNPTLNGGTFFDIDSDLHTGTPPASSTITQDASGAWGSANGFASADLATGELKARSQVTFTGSSDSVYHQVNAYYGDGFRASDASGSPFSWQPDSTARFSLDVEGFFTSSPSLPTLGGGAFIYLGIYEANALPSPTGNLAGSPGLIQYFFYTIGNAGQQVFSCASEGGGCTALIPTRYLGTLNGTRTVVQDFQPGADFDYVLLVGESGQMTVPGTWDMDLGHTVTFNYEGPRGSTTTSVSGTFANYNVPNNVPAPAGGLLLALATLAMGALRRTARAA